MLFCGDCLRFESDKELKTFNVCLLKWIRKLLNPETSLDSHNPKKRKTSYDHIFRISFIQVCTNHLRHPQFFLKEQQLLKDWYEAGLAYFACSQAFAFDFVAPICFSSNGYCPLLVQFKNRVSFSEDDKDSAINNLKKAFEGAEVKIGVGIVLLLGHEYPKTMKDKMGSPSYTTEMVKNVRRWCEDVCDGKEEIFTCCISVPDSDCFGITDFARSSSFGGGQGAEIYESHSIINQVSKSETNDNELLKFVRSSTKVKNTNYMKNMYSAFKKALAIDDK